MENEFLSDIQAIRQRAWRHMELGPVTESYHAEGLATLLAQINP